MRYNLFAGATHVEASNGDLGVGCILTSLNVYLRQLKQPLWGAGYHGTQEKDRESGDQQLARNSRLRYALAAQQPCISVLGVTSGLRGQ